MFIKSLPTYEWSPEWQLGWPPRWGVEACAGRGLPTFSSKSSGVGGTSSTPASLETPPNALVTHLMTMTTLILGLNLNLRFVILHPFQIWELQNMLLTLLFNFEGDRTVKYFLLSIEGKIDEKEYVVNYLQENSNWKLRWFGPTWTNLDQRKVTLADFLTAPPQAQAGEGMFRGGIWKSKKLESIPKSRMSCCS